MVWKRFRARKRYGSRAWNKRRFYKRSVARAAASARTRSRTSRRSAFAAARGLTRYRRSYSNSNVRPVGFRRVVPYRIYRTMHFRQFYHEGSLSANEFTVGGAGMQQLTFRWNDMYDPDARWSAGSGPATPYLRRMMDLYNNYYVFSAHVSVSMWQNTQSSGFANEPLYAFIGLCKDSNGLNGPNTPEEIGLRPHTYMKAFTSNAIVNNKNGVLKLSMNFNRHSYRRMGWTVDQNTFDEQQWAGHGYQSPSTAGFFVIGIINPSNVEPICNIRFNISIRFNCAFYVPKDENFALLQDEEDDRDADIPATTEYEPNHVESNDADPPVHVP